MATPSNAIVTLRGGLVVRIAALELLLALEERGCVLCLEQDGTLFVVEIITADGGPQSFEWEYPLLKLVAQLLQPLR